MVFCSQMGRGYQSSSPSSSEPDADHAIIARGRMLLACWRFRGPLLPAPVPIGPRRLTQLPTCVAQLLHMSDSEAVIVGSVDSEEAVLQPRLLRQRGPAAPGEGPPVVYAVCGSFLPSAAWHPAKRCHSDFQKRVEDIRREVLVAGVCPFPSHTCLFLSFPGVPEWGASVLVQSKQWLDKRHVHTSHRLACHS